MKRFYDEHGNLAILISPGFGTGWSTDNEILEFAIDAELVKMVYDAVHPSSVPKEKIEKRCKEIVDEIDKPDPYFYLNLFGWNNVIIKWIPKGKVFQIRNYDGNEYIQYFNKEEWIEA